MLCVCTFTEGLVLSPIPNLVLMSCLCGFSSHQNDTPLGDKEETVSINSTINFQFMSWDKGKTTDTGPRRVPYQCWHIILTQYHP